MKISIVIPVYNEAGHLADCLNSIAKQTRMPDEIIVVDNNSSDGSLAVAESFDFVTVIKELRQGVVHARNTGFNAAQGELIGRIDADTILPANWVENAIETITGSDADATSGSTHYYDFGLSNIADRIDLKLRGWLSSRLGDDRFLWGANMVIKKSAWNRVKSQLCIAHGEHEDLDLALHLQDAGLKVAYEPSLVAFTSSRRLDMNPKGYLNYSLAGPRTYASHGKKSRFYMYPVISICWLVYIPGRIIFRAYDKDLSKWSLTGLFAPVQSRVDPTSTNV